jgi:hypothetical protein
MQVITPCSLQRMHTHKYQWRKLSLIQEYGHQPIRVDVQSSHLLSYQNHTKRLYAQHANNSDYSLFAGEGVSSSLTIVCLGLAIFKYHLGRVNKA